MGTAVRVDIDEELKAVNRGECGGCRIGCTHTHIPACDLKLSSYVSDMVRCKECNTMWNKGPLFNFTVCPMCGATC